MCGIAGALSRDSGLAPLMNMILKDQVARGPDHTSAIDITSQSLKISLGHNRLAILDLADRSNQPFIDPQTGACMVFNGEIYNYIELRQELRSHGIQFATNSDTEVLLKAFLTWGPDVYTKLNGMFAFAVWDPEEQKLTLARDRFGVKPCYYLNKLGNFAFASNTTALADYFHLAYDEDYLAHGCTYNLYEDGEGSSPYQEIKAVPPGHFLEFHEGSIRTYKFYDLAEEVAEESEYLRSLSDEQILLRLEERLRSSVHLRLRADVPTTISLSGGLDSSLLAFLMSEESNRPREAFTFGNLTDPRSEGHLAKLSADKLGFKLHLTDLKQEELPEIFERTLCTQGAPFAHPSVMAQYRVYESMRKHGYRVSIGGQGADEIFLGYRKFQFFNVKDQWRHRQWRHLPQAAWSLALMLSAEVGSPRKLVHYFHRYARHQDPPAPFQHVRGKVFDIGINSYPDLRARQIADVGFASLATLLRYEDRNSMGNSVESRMPFLDYRVVQTGIALPARFKIQNGYGKWILRKISQNRLPDVIINSRVKLAFSLDAHDWLKGGLGKHLQQGVQPHLNRFSDLLSPSAVDLLRQPESFHNPGNFPLLVTAYWLARQK